VAGALDLGSALVNGDISDSAIFSAGNVGMIAGRSILSSTIRAGIAALLPGQSLPASAADFATAASIASLRLGSDPRRAAFANSTIAASHLGELSLGRIQTNNGGAAFGVAANSIKLLQGIDITTGHAFRLTNVASTAAAAAALAAQHINPQDFLISII
jgi:hypothetical protein